MINAVLVGSPNAGKTTLFNSLTGKNLKTGNWHGVTVDKSQALVPGENIILSDLPGIYSEVALSPEEKVSEEYINNNKDSLFLSVVPAFDLERGIKLTKSLINKSLKTLLVITFFDEFKKGKGFLDVDKLKEMLGVPVVCVNGNDKKDAKRLLELIKTAFSNFTPIKIEGDIKLEKIYKNRKLKESFLDKIFLNKPLSLITFFVIIFLMLFVTFSEHCLGVFLQKNAVFLVDKLKDVFCIALLKINCNKVVVSFLTDGVLSGVSGVVSFIPQLIILYAFLIFFEESGILSRIAFMFDDFFVKIGLNGRAVFSLLMGFGCTTVGVFSTRALEINLKNKTALSLAFIPCTARLPVYLMMINTFFAKNRIFILVLAYLTGIIFMAVTSSILNKRLYNNSDTMLLEMPVLRGVNVKKLLKTLLYYAKQFIIKVGTSITLVITLLWVLKSFSFTFSYVGENIEKSILFSLGKGLRFLLYPMGITDWRLSVAVISGLFAKEAVLSTVDLLFSLGLSGVLNASQALSFLIFLCLYTPCFSTLIAVKKELGFKKAVILGISTFAVALVFGYITYFCALFCAFLQLKPAILIIVILITLILLFTFNKKTNCKNCCCNTEDNNERNCKCKKSKTS